VSVHTHRHPEALRASCCNAGSCTVVDTLAYPNSSPTTTQTESDAPRHTADVREWQRLRGGRRELAAPITARNDAVLMTDPLGGSLVSPHEPDRDHGHAPCTERGARQHVRDRVFATEERRRQVRTEDALPDRQRQVEGGMVVRIAQSDVVVEDIDYPPHRQPTPDPAKQRCQNPARNRCDSRLRRVSKPGAVCQSLLDTWGSSVARTRACGHWPSVEDWSVRRSRSPAAITAIVRMSSSSPAVLTSHLRRTEPSRSRR